jgi:Nuclease-related domain
MARSSTHSPWPAPDLDADIAALPPPSLDQASLDQASLDQAPLDRSVGANRLGRLLSDGARRLSTDERAIRTAAKAEQRIIDELIDLPPGWFVLHSVELTARPDPVGGTDDVVIDHVVIGRSGVFTLHLEHHPGANVWVSEHAVMIDGRATDHLRHARFEARRCSRLLSDACGFDVTAQSVMVMIGASDVQAANRPAEVHVRTQLDLRDWLCRQPARFGADTVAAIHRQARFVETWRPDTV